MRAREEELRWAAREFIGRYQEEIFALYNAKDDGPRKQYNKDAMEIFKQEVSIRAKAVGAILGVVADYERSTRTRMARCRRAKASASESAP
jgi:hypothetical protein